MQLTLVKYIQSQLSSAACKILAAMIFLLSVLPVLADDPISLEPANALELLEAEILKNQERAGKSSRVKPTSPALKAPPSVLPVNPEPVVPLNPLQNQEESLPPPIRPESLPVEAPRVKSVDSTRADPNAIKTAAPSGVSYLGLTLHKPSGNLLGLRVVSVADKSPAWKTGFLVSDRILAVSDQAVSSIDEFAEILAQYGPGDAVRFLIDRNGRKREFTSILMDRELADRTLPENELAFDRSTRSVPLRATNSIANVTRRSRSFGLALAPLSNEFRTHFGIPAYRGASVLEVKSNSPAAQAGLAPGDCIVEINDQTIESDRDVINWQYEAESGALLRITFYRGAGLIQSQIRVPGQEQIVYEQPVQAMPLGAVVQAPLNDEVQQEIVELRREVQRLREELRAAESRR